MESATKRFFGIAELVGHLRQFISHKEFSRLMRTSRQLHELCASGFYHGIEDVEECRQLFSSTDSIKALARNIRHVRQLSIGPSELSHYTSCVVAYQDDAFRCVATDTTTKDHSPHRQFFQAQRPLWLAPPDPHNRGVLPIPPMTLLTKLTFRTKFSVTTKRRPYLTQSSKDPKATLTHLCWIMDLNPNLLDVSLDRVFIKDQRDVRLLTTSISGLKSLQRLRLEFYHEDSWEMPFGLTSTLFYCCPTSLRSLDLYLAERTYLWGLSVLPEYLSTAQGNLQPWEKDEVECGIPATIARRQEPLLYLMSLDISHYRDDSVSEDDLASILAHCPNLTNIGLPRMREFRDIQVSSQRIAQLCPNLTGIRNMNTIGVAAQRLAIQILGALPQHQVNKFKCCSGLPFLDQGVSNAGWLFQRHASTLRSITLYGCLNFDTKAIQTILVACLALEQFVVHREPTDFQRCYCIDLEDAIEVPWGCTGIQELTLNVSIPDEPLHYLAEDTVPYYNRPPPIKLSTAEKDQFRSLEAFYRQIGVLTELQKLDLRAIFYDPQNRRPVSGDYNFDTFPGMLSLSCEESGRPGFLHHFAGLTKLEELWGIESRETIGMREVEWMAQHWPALA